MAQLPGRIQLRPLAQYTNRPKTHTVSLKNEKMGLSIKYPYQTLNNELNYKDINTIYVSGSDNLQSDPLTKNVTITTKTRQSYEIPEMETYQAMKLKDAIETQQSLSTKVRENISKKSDSSHHIGGFVKYRR